MRKLLLLLMAVVLSFGLAACDEGGTDSGGSESQTDDSTAETESETDDSSVDEATEEENSDAGALGIGDTAEVDGVQFTLLGVSTTDERNEFADTDPAMVVKIEYEIVNNSDEEIPIGADLEVYDGTGAKMESYPLDNTMGSLQPGKRIEGVEHFGIEEGPIEIYFAPMFTFEDPAIFVADVE